MKLELNFKNIIDFIRVNILKRPKEGEIWFAKLRLEGRHFSVKEFGKISRVLIVQVTPSVLVIANDSGSTAFVARKNIKFLSKAV